jgi:starvation-inducible DNA-binding protein
MATTILDEQFDIGLTEEERQGVVDIMQTVLADANLLYVKLRNYHWNVTGPQFRSLHELFEEQYETLAEAIDRIAERIRTYGGPAIGTLQEFKTRARLTETPGDYPHARQMVQNLVNDHEAIIRALRKDLDTVGETYNDLAGQDFLIALLQEHQDMAWMLRTFIEGPPVHE